MIKQTMRRGLLGVALALVMMLTACYSRPTPDTKGGAGGTDEAPAVTQQAAPEEPEAEQPLPDDLPEEGSEAEEQQPDLPEEGEDFSEIDPTSWAVGAEHDQFPEAGGSWNEVLRAC